MSGSTPREVWERAQRFVLAHDADGYADMFAPDGVQELPFTVPGLPREIRGPQEIRDRLGPAMRAGEEAGRRHLGHDNVVIHETVDPEVMVVEFELVGEHRDGSAYRLPYVHVVRVRDGKIVSLRDYLDSFAIARVLGVGASA